MAQLMARTWRFKTTLGVVALSDQYEACSTFKEFWNPAHAILEMRGLERSSFSYDVPEDGLEQISGYVHVKNKCNIAEATSKTWIFDDRIHGEFEWRPVLPGKLGDWTQHVRDESAYRCWTESLRGPASNKCAASSASWSVSLLICFLLLDFSIQLLDKCILLLDFFGWFPLANFLPRRSFLPRRPSL